MWAHDSTKTTEIFEISKRMQKQTKKFLYEHTHYNKLLNLCVWDYNFDLVVVKHYSVAEENKEKLIHTHSLCICKKGFFEKAEFLLWWNMESVCMARVYCKVHHNDRFLWFLFRKTLYIRIDFIYLIYIFEELDKNRKS